MGATHWRVRVVPFQKTALRNWPPRSLRAFHPNPWRDSPSRAPRAEWANFLRSARHPGVFPAGISTVLLKTRVLSRWAFFTRIITHLSPNPVIRTSQCNMMNAIWQEFSMRKSPVLGCIACVLLEQLSYNLYILVFFNCKINKSAQRMRRRPTGCERSANALRNFPLWAQLQFLINSKSIPFKVSNNPRCEHWAAIESLAIAPEAIWAHLRAKPHLRWLWFYCCNEGEPLSWIDSSTHTRVAGKRSICNCDRASGKGSRMGSSCLSSVLRAPVVTHERFEQRALRLRTADCRVRAKSVELLRVRLLASDSKSGCGSSRTPRASTIRSGALIAHLICTRSTARAGNMPRVTDAERRCEARTNWCECCAR